MVGRHQGFLQARSYISQLYVRRRRQKCSTLLTTGSGRISIISRQCIDDIATAGTLAHRSSNSVSRCRHSSLFFRGFQAGSLDLARKAEPFQKTNAIVIDIDLIPGQSVTGRYRICVMVVVPSFPAGQQRYPKIVPRIVTRGKAPCTPQMRDGIDHPGYVKSDGCRQNCAPQEPGPSAEREKRNANDGQRNPVIFTEPDIVAVPRQIRSIALECL